MGNVLSSMRALVAIGTLLVMKKPRMY